MFIIELNDSNDGKIKFLDYENICYLSSQNQKKVKQYIDDTLPMLPEDLNKNYLKISYSLLEDNEIPK